MKIIYVYCLKKKKMFLVTASMFLQALKCLSTLSDL